MKKKEKRPDFSAYRGMWLFSMFDLPVDTAAARNRYTRFRKGLLRQGFTMLQFSVYARYCGSEEKAKILKSRLKSTIPGQGQVRFLMVTDRQFAKMEVYCGRKPVDPEAPPEQLVLF
jgi:CRISPR-associated protein Cas2